MCAKLQTRSPPRGYICENTLNAGPATNLREHLENSVARPRSWLFRATSPAFPFRAALRSTRVAYIAVLSACDLHLLSLLAADSSHPPGVQPLCKCDPLCSQSSIIESHTAWYEAGVDGGEGAGTEGEHNAGAEGEHIYNGGSEGGRPPPRVDGAGARGLSFGTRDQQQQRQQSPSVGGFRGPFYPVWVPLGHLGQSVKRGILGQRGV